MAGEVNPRQFISLDYANADMYSALSQRPAPSTPLQKSTSVTEVNRENASTRAMEQNLWQEESARNAGYFLEQKQQSDAREEEITRREQAQRNEIANRVANNSPASPEVAPTPESPLEAPPSSTPERQPVLSTGRPPPTPNGTAARASPMVEPTATPAPAGLAEPVSPGGGGFGALPRSLPQAAGRFAIPGAFAAGDFAVRVVQGQPVTQAASGAVATTAGAVAGAIVGTAIAGPVGEVIGGFIGGYIGGAIADSFFSPPSGQLPISQPLGLPPWKGGALFQIYATIFSNTTEHDIEFAQNGGIDSATWVSGKVTGISAPYYFDFGLGNAAHTGYTVSSVLANGGTTERNVISPSVVWRGDVSSSQMPHLKGFQLINQNNSGLTDYDPASLAVVPDTRTPESVSHPGNFDYGVPSGIPQPKIDRPLPAIGVSGGKNIAQTPRGDNPNLVPHAGLAPRNNPNPTQTPSNLGGNLPSTAPAPAPPPFAEPKDIPPPRFAPAPGGSASPDPGGSASAPGGSVAPDPNVSRIENGVVTSPPILTAQPIPLNSSPATIPSSSPRTSKQNPTSDANSPVPKAQLSPTPNTPEAAADKTNQLIQQQKKDFDEQITRLTTIAGLIAGLTPIVQGIPDAIAKSPAIQAANKATTQGAVCEIAQPGGCLGDALDNSADKINQNNNKNTNSLLDKINAGANAAQLALLNIINNKLGDQLIGGISGFLQTFFEGFKKLADWLHLDRALNLLTFVMTVQNVYFLCDSMKVVTLQMISDMLAVVGIKDKDNNPLNLNEILGHEVEELLKSILGEKELSGFKKEWKALNRIYQAATNTLFAIQNMVFSVLQALEIIGSWNASIGNALKKYLVVGQKAFEWMNPNPNFHNNFFKFMGEALNVVTSLDFVAQSILQGRQAIDDFGKQTDELSKGIAEASDGFKPPENKATAEAATKSAQESKSPIPSPEDVKSIQD